MAIIGSILGDIAGSQYEFYHPKNLDWENCELFSEQCIFTDDTVMTLAIKSAIDNNKNYQDEVRRIGRKYPDCGYGGRFIEWMFSNNPQPYGSFGNGSAMRVSYLADYYSDLEELQKETEKATIFSHNSEEGIKGAITVVTCIWMAKNGRTKEDIYNYVLEKYPPVQYKYSGKTIEQLKIEYKEDVTCMSGIPAAARCFYESESYISFLRNIFRFENDADTFGAMFGGVAEEYYGKTGLKNQKILEHYLDSYLLNILNGGEKHMIQYRIKYDGEWVNIQRMLGTYSFTKVKNEDEAKLLSDKKVKIGLSAVNQDSNIDQSKIEIISYE